MSHAFNCYLDFIKQLNVSPMLPMTIFFKGGIERHFALSLSPNS